MTESLQNWKRGQLVFAAVTEDVDDNERDGVNEQEPEFDGAGTGEAEYDWKRHGDGVTTNTTGTGTLQRTGTTDLAVSISSSTLDSSVRNQNTGMLAPPITAIAPIPRHSRRASEKRCSITAGSSHLSPNMKHPSDVIQQECDAPTSS